MNLEHLRNYCLAKKGVTEEFPFDETTVVYKVLGKIFVITDIETFESINLKVNPEEGVELRERHPSVQPGYHMNKKHWVTVLIDGSIPDTLLLKWIDNSYELVFSRLTKKQKLALEPYKNS